MIDSTDTNITQGKFKDWIKTSNSANPMSGSGGRGEKNEKGRSLFFLPHSWEDEDRLLEKCGVDALKTGHTYVHSDTVQLKPAAAVYPTTSNAAVATGTRLRSGAVGRTVIARSRRSVSMERSKKYVGETFFEKRNVKNLWPYFWRTK